MKKTILIYRLIDWKDKMLSSSPLHIFSGNWEKFLMSNFIICDRESGPNEVVLRYDKQCFQKPKMLFQFQGPLINSYLTIIRLPQNKLKIIKFLNFHFPRRVFQQNWRVKSCAKIENTFSLISQILQTNSNFLVVQIKKYRDDNNLI